MEIGNSYCCRNKLEVMEDFSGINSGINTTVDLNPSRCTKVQPFLHFLLIKSNHEFLRGSSIPGLLVSPTAASDHEKCLEDTGTISRFCSVVASTDKHLLSKSVSSLSEGVCPLLCVS